MDTKSIIEKIKQGILKNQESVILVIGVMLVSLISFAAGYILAGQENKEQMQVEQDAEDSCGVHVQ